jgi:hypothetical protein
MRPSLCLRSRSCSKDVLHALADEHRTDDIATAAQMLASATRIIGDELFVVDAGRLGREPA